MSSYPYCKFCGTYCSDWICEICWKLGKHIKDKKMASYQESLNEEDAKTILDILKKYDAPHINNDGECDDDGNMLIPYIECSIKISDFDDKSEEDLIKNMYIQTDTNR